MTPKRATTEIVNIFESELCPTPKENFWLLIQAAVMFLTVVVVGFPAQFALVQTNVVAVGGVAVGKASILLDEAAPVLAQTPDLYVKKVRGMEQVVSAYETTV